MSIPTALAHHRHLIFFLLWITIPEVSARVLPNIVILYADDMGVRDVSYGDPDARIQTPNIDRLANGGMTFTDGHS